MWKSWTLACRMSSVICSEVKLNFVEWYGVGSTNRAKTPNINFKLRRVQNRELFCYERKLNGKSREFKIDMGSDVSILSSNLMNNLEIRNVEKNIRIVYPTGEIVPIHSRAIVKVELGKFSLELPMFVANISDDCLLEIDFLFLIGIEFDFCSALGIPQKNWFAHD